MHRINRINLADTEESIIYCNIFLVNCYICILNSLNLFYCFFKANKTC